MPTIPWGEYKPDVSEYNGMHSAVIQNVVPRGDGYGPFKALSAFTDALTAACRGMFRALSADGSIKTFAGTATKLYLLDNADGSWDNVSSSSGATNYTIASSDQWQFAQFGNFVVAVLNGNPPQVYEIGTSTYFADLAGSPPQARYVTIVGQFLVLSGLTSLPFRIQWSAISDITGWTAGTNQSDFQDFSDGGFVRGVAGGEFGIIFQDAAIRRLIYSPGSAEIFRIERISEGEGLLAPYSIVRAAERILFLSPHGFHEMLATGYPVPIGKEKVDRTFFEDWDNSSPQLMIGANDPTSHRVYWAYKSTSGQTGLFDKMLCYDYVLQRFTTISVTGEYLSSLAQAGITLENLDSISSSIDALTVSLDDVTLGTGLFLSACDSNHQIGFFSGSNLEATLETAEVSNESRTAFVRGHRPVTDAPTVYGSVSARMNAQDARIFGAETLVNALGSCPHRKSARLYRFRDRIPASTTWTFSIGAEPDVKIEGRR